MRSRPPDSACESLSIHVSSEVRVTVLVAVDVVVVLVVSAEIAEATEPYVAVAVIAFTLLEIKPITNVATAVLTTTFLRLIPIQRQSWQYRGLIVRSNLPETGSLFHRSKLRQTTGLFLGKKKLLAQLSERNCTLSGVKKSSYFYPKNP